MAAVSRGIIDETSNAVPLNGFFLGNILFLFFVFRKCIFTCVFICSFFVNLHFLSYYFSALNIIQGFSLNQRGLCLNRLERTLGRAVDKLLNGSRVKIHTGSLFLESKAWVCFEATRLSTKTEGVISHIF